MWDKLTEKDINILGKYLSFSDLDYINSLSSPNGINVFEDINKINLSEKYHYVEYIKSYAYFPTSRNYRLILAFSFDKTVMDYVIVEVYFFVANNHKVEPFRDYHNFLNVLEFCNIFLGLRIGY